MTDQTHIANSDQRLEHAISELRRQYRQHRYVEVHLSVGERQRSDQQRKAIEVYCRELAATLNDAGLDQRQVLAAMREGVEIPWSHAAVKDTLWRRVQIALTGKQSSTRLTREEVSQVYDALNRWLSDRFGVSVAFPEREAA